MISEGINPFPTMMDEQIRMMCPELDTGYILHNYYLSSISIVRSRIKCGMTSIKQQQPPRRRKWIIYTI